MTIRYYHRPLQVTLATTLLAAVFPLHLRAQCADGTPPPCDVAVRRPAVVARDEPPAQDVRARSFLVLPFRNVRGIAEDDWLGESSLMLGNALSQWQEISTVPDGRLYPALRRHGLTPGDVMDEAQVRRVAEETGGWTAVTGEVLRIGDRIQISARALDVVTGRVVVRVQEQTESEDEIQDVYKRIATALLKTVGVDASAVDLSSVTTASIGALRAYMRGLRHYHRYEMRRAREAFEEAIGLDSTFALPYLKLAESWLLFSSMDAFSDAAHPAYGHLTRAVALSDRLPSRERQFLRAMDAFFHGQFAAAREQLDVLLARDSTDVDVLIALAWLESLDGVLVPVNGKLMVRGSLNRANNLAKRAVLLDPLRSGGYGILVHSYLTAAGWILGVVPTARSESASLPAHWLSMVMNITPYTPVLRDTLELIPLDFEDYLAGRYNEERANALTVARTWVERWLVATPSVAEAHMWAAWVLELEEFYDRALAELEIADSLGVETELENLTARRMVLLAEAGRHPEALQLSDSLRTAGLFANPRLIDPFVWVYGGAAFSLYLINGDWANASGLMDELSGPLTAIAPALGEMIIATLCSATSPKPLRREALSRILHEIRAYPSTESMEDCLGALFEAAWSEADPALRAELAADAVDAADSLLTSTEHHNLAFTLAIDAIGADSTEETLLRALATFRRITELDPDNMAALYQVGRMALFAETDLDLAIRSFLRYLEHEQQPGAPSYVAAHWRLGMVYELQGKIDEARTAYEAALKLDPDYVPAREALAKLSPKP